MNTRYFLADGKRVSIDEAIQAIHAGQEVKVAAPSIGDAFPRPEDCVSVHQAARDTYEVTAPDGTVLDTVRFILVDALHAAGDFVRPFFFVLDQKITALELDIRSLQESGDDDLAANAFRELHALRRVKAHLIYEQTKRGERDADGPPTGRERYLDPEG